MLKVATTAFISTVYYLLDTRHFAKRALSKKTKKKHKGHKGWVALTYIRPSFMTFAQGTQIHVHFPWVNTQILKCESTCKHFQQTEGPSH